MFFDLLGLCLVFRWKGTGGGEDFYFRDPAELWNVPYASLSLSLSLSTMLIRVLQGSASARGGFCFYCLAPFKNNNENASFGIWTEIGSSVYLSVVDRALKVILVISEDNCIKSGHFPLS